MSLGSGASEANQNAGSSPAIPSNPMGVKGDGNVYCWLCNRKIENYPDTAHPIYVDDELKAICGDPCIDKANILIQHKFSKAISTG